MNEFRHLSDVICGLYVLRINNISVSFLVFQFSRLKVKQSLYRPGVAQKVPGI
jgi:hypothetical protein